jgi:hypothetical protein
MSDVQKDTWTRPDVRAKRGKAISDAQAKPEVKKKQSQVRVEWWSKRVDRKQTPEHVAKGAASRTGLVRSEASKAKTRATRSQPEVAAAISSAIIAAWDRKRNEMTPEEYAAFCVKRGEDRRGKVCSAAARANISASKQGQMAGPDNPFYGQTHSEDTLTKMRGPRNNAEARARMSAAKQGTNAGPSNPFFGKTHSEEALSKMRGRIKTPEERAKMSRTKKENNLLKRQIALLDWSPNRVIPTQQAA